MIALAIALALFLGLGPVEAGAQADEPEVRSVRFEGNASFSDQALANAIVTRQTECRSMVVQPFCWAGADWARDPFFLDDRNLARDVSRIRLFYYQRGFREARADTILERLDEREVRVTFRIEEGRPVLVDSLTVAGLEALPDTVRVSDALPLRPGDRLSGLLLDATRDTLQTRLRNRGYPHVDVLRSHFIPSEDPYRARVTYDVFPGTRAYVGPLTVVGNQEVSESVVRRMLPFEEGDPYRQDLIFEAQRSLYNLEIFRHAEIRADLENVPDSVVPLRVQVNEGDVHRVRVGGGWNTADCMSGESRWTSRNYFGGARRLQVRGRISNVFAPDLHDSICSESGSGEFGRLTGLLSADFTQPWLFSPRNSLTANLYVERQSLKDIFVREAVGVNLFLTRSVGRRQNLTLGYEPQLATLEAAEIFFCTSFLVCEPGDIDVLAGANWLAPLSVRYTQERTNQILNPTRGYTFQVQFEHASDYTGSEFAYNRLVGEVNRYWPLGSDWVAAGRLRAGWMDPRPFGKFLDQAGTLQIVHPQKRFFAGGSNSVRGFAENQLGPRNLSVPVETLLGTPSADPDDPSPICTPQEVRNLECDAGALHDGAFTSRPTGGSNVLEGSVEVRYPLLGPRSQGVMFLDFGEVWSDAGNVDLGDLRLAPGVGFRYVTPIGPIRVDVGYRLEGGERLRVVTSQIEPEPFDPEGDPEEERLHDPEGNPLDFVRSDGLAILRPPVLYEDDGPWSLNRFQLHLSLGQAF